LFGSLFPGVQPNAKGENMTVSEISASRNSGLVYTMWIAQTEKAIDYPGNPAAPREDILARLRELDERTRDKLDRFSGSLREQTSFQKLSRDELYMLRQRLYNGRVCPACAGQGLRLFKGNGNGRAR
jgi:hypothetical protein